jgi:SMC interacting uncharacterized protein involved in chromosome segregation
MTTHEESLSAVELAQVRVDEAVSDLNHHVTILIGIAQKEEWGISEIKGSLRAIDGRLNSLVSRFETQEHRIENLRQYVNTRFEQQDKKLDQILLLLNTFIPKQDQES